MTPSHAWRRDRARPARPAAGFPAARRPADAPVLLRDGGEPVPARRRARGADAAHDRTGHPVGHGAVVVNAVDGPAVRARPGRRHARATADVAAAPVAAG